MSSPPPSARPPPGLCPPPAGALPSLIPGLRPASVRPLPAPCRGSAQPHPGLFPASARRPPALPSGIRRARPRAAARHLDKSLTKYKVELADHLERNGDAAGKRCVGGSGLFSHDSAGKALIRRVAAARTSLD